MSGMRRCVFCGAEVQGNYRKVEGWQRRERGHGLNHLMMRKETGEQACDACGYDIAHGVAPGTPKLFDIPTPPLKTTRRDHA